MEVKKQYDYLFKIVTNGESGVGKSSTVLRMAKNEFSDQWMSTIGIDFVVKTIDIDGKRVKIQIWDTSGGRERFVRLSTTQYRRSMGIILVYDITDENSFRQLVERFVPHMEEHAPPNCVKMILGNKCDLAESRTVSTESGKELAAKHGYRFLEVSAKTGQNMEQALMDMTKDIMIGVDSNTIEPIKPQPVHTDAPLGKKTKCF